MPPKKPLVKLKLTKEQNEHLKTVEWLLGDDRASGRSTVMALAFITTAVKKPNNQIEVFDHKQFVRAREHMMLTLDRLTKEMGIREQFLFNNRQFTIMYDARP